MTIIRRLIAWYRRDRIFLPENDDFIGEVWPAEPIAFQGYSDV